MSSLSDVAGTGEDKRRGRAPKENVPCKGFLGYVLNKYITVIFLDGALSEETGKLIPALMGPVVFIHRSAKRRVSALASAPQTEDLFTRRRDYANF